MNDTSVVKNRQASNTGRTLVGNKIVDHSNYIIILDLTTGFNVLDKDNRKRDENHKVLGVGAAYVKDFTVCYIVLSRCQREYIGMIM